MPIYVFKCTDCEKRFERIMKSEELQNEKIECKECMKPAERVLTSAHYAPISNNGASVRPNFSKRKAERR